MRFFKRAISGSLLTLATLALLATAGWRLESAVSNATSKQRPPARERSYTVDIATLSARAISPKIKAYGQVQAWRTLEIRAPASGPITELSPNFRDGLTVKADELLFRIDPELANRRVVDARAALAQAKFELAEAKLSLSHVEAELASAAAQIAVRETDLARKRTLYGKKLTTVSVVDDATLALSAARQAELAKRQSVLAAKGRIDKAEAGVERAELTLKDTEKMLSETHYRAPFSGRLTDVAATLGRRISNNEKLALLIDPRALEVSFQLRNADFGHLIDPEVPGRLAHLPVKVTLDLKENSITVDGVLDRAATVAGAQAGRTVYAKLNADQASALRPGDFVTVTISEPTMKRVAVVPSEAATADGRLLLIGNNGRLEEHQAKILRHQDDEIIVADVPFGRSYVRLRLPFLAPGIKVRSRRSEDPVAAAGGASKRQQASTGEDGMAIDDTKRAALIKLVEASTRMPQHRRQRVLAELKKEKPSRRIIERLERRLARSGSRS
jgi:multidrug resistance efflux pump